MSLPVVKARGDEQFLDLGAHRVGLEITDQHEHGRVGSRRAVMKRHAIGEGNFIERGLLASEIATKRVAFGIEKLRELLGRDRGRVVE